MHAVAVSVTIKDEGAARKVLGEQVVPGVSQLPGALAGYWLAPDGNRGYSLVVFESEDAARAAADTVAERIPDAVELNSVQVHEVVEHF